MLTSIFVNNYILIDNLEIDFHQGFSTITGETGAGKSIVLGALSLILGQRSDTNILLNKSKKCIIEGRFNIGKYNLQTLFERYDLDFEITTSLRREVIPSGKSRAFINDTPVTLKILKEIGSLLVDIHSQHQNLILNDANFQFLTIDSYSQQLEIVEEYNRQFHDLNQMKTLLNQKISAIEKIKSDSDYLQFQFNELEEAKLKDPDELEKQEEEFQLLNHTEEIKVNLSKMEKWFSSEEFSIMDSLKNTIKLLEQSEQYYPPLKNITKRTHTCYYELEDILKEIETSNENIDFTPARLNIVEERLNLIYSLQKKHKVDSIAKLTQLKLDIETKLDKINISDNEIGDIQKQIINQENNLKKIATEISSKRQTIIPEIEKTITEQLIQLGIPNAQFKISNTRGNKLMKHGIDIIVFLFSANKNKVSEAISKIASGGEMARLMLSIKSLIAETEFLPTLIFDEIDTGVSGKIAHKMGNIMTNISKRIQVISITHLPQIASRGQHHYKVYKKDNEKSTNTYIKKLTEQERIDEIAKMLSGEGITEASLTNAKELLLNL